MIDWDTIEGPPMSQYSAYFVGFVKLLPGYQIWLITTFKTNGRFFHHVHLDAVEKSCSHNGHYLA